MEQHSKPKFLSEEFLRPLRLVQPQGGFSLIQAVVTAAVLSVLALVGATLSVNQFKSMRTVETQEAIRQHMGELAYKLANQQLCSANIKGAGANARLASTTFEDSAVPAGDARIAVTKFHPLVSGGANDLDSAKTLFSPDQPVAGIGGVKVVASELVILNQEKPNEYLARLNLRFDRGLGVMGQSEVRRSISLKINTTGAPGSTQTLDSCQALASQFDTSEMQAAIDRQACIAVGGTYNPGPPSRCTPGVVRLSDCAAATPYVDPANPGDVFVCSSDPDLSRSTYSNGRCPSGGGLQALRPIQSLSNGGNHTDLFDNSSNGMTYAYSFHCLNGKITPSMTYWTNTASRQPAAAPAPEWQPGAMCGFSVDAVTAGQGGPIIDSIRCQGMRPYDGCPAGFTRIRLMDLSAAAVSYYSILWTCVKD